MFFSRAKICQTALLVKVRVVFLGGVTFKNLIFTICIAAEFNTFSCIDTGLSLLAAPLHFPLTIIFHHVMLKESLYSKMDAKAKCLALIFICITP